MRDTAIDAMPVTLADAQQDMQDAYFGGATGMMTSALVWLVSGLAALQFSADHAVWTLLIGGVFIHPVSTVLNKALGRSGTHSAANPLAGLAMATTFWMILCMPLAYAVSLMRIEWFFPAMLVIIGGRYMTFSTLYGTRVYWACGGTLAAAACLLLPALAPPYAGAFAGAAIEAAFAAIIFATSVRRSTLLGTS